VEHDVLEIPDGGAGVEQAQDNRKPRMSRKPDSKEHDAERPKRDDHRAIGKFR
jgi:hypothetical protein